MPIDRTAIAGNSIEMLLLQKKDALEYAPDRFNPMDFV
jgi:hypothetical protein